MLVTTAILKVEKYCMPHKHRHDIHSLIFRGVNLGHIGYSDQAVILIIHNIEN